jgi:proliferating cell nuclear antigen
MVWRTPKTMQAQSTDESIVFVARTESPLEWKIISQAIQTMVDEATFDVSQDGIRFKGMDPARVALVDLLWPAQSFERFECHKPDEFTVLIEDFAKLLKRAENKDSVEISRQASDSLSLKFLGGYSREFKLHLIEPRQNGSTPLPKLAFDSRFVVSQVSFAQALADVSTISNQLTISTTEDRILFSGKGDAGKAQVTLLKGSVDVREIVVTGEAKESVTTYNIEYLTKITKAVGGISDSVKLEYSSKMPLRLEFSLSGGGRIHYYLAPRITD